jgi:hypothetical protein
MVITPRGCFSIGFRRQVEGPNRTRLADFDGTLVGEIYASEAEDEHFRAEGRRPHEKLP